jgi:hypothetical protein
VHGVYDLVVRPASVVTDRPAALGVTNARRTAATLYAAASLSLVAAVLVAASTPDVRLDGCTLGAIAAYPMPLAVTIAWARPRGTNGLAFELALLHAGSLLVGSVGLALGVGIARLGWAMAGGIVLVVPVFAGIVAIFAGPATGFVVARRARRGIGYLAATTWFPIWVVREILLRR